MKAREQQIINMLLEAKESGYSSQWDIEEALEQLIQEETLGSSSTEFRNNPAINALIEKSYGDTKNYFKLWLRIEDYIASKGNVGLAQKKLA
jgi:hypothetical protein